MIAKLEREQTNTQRILGKFLFISCLPDNALRTLVDIMRLSELSTFALNADPGKLDIKRRDSGIVFISLPMFHSLN